MPKGNQGKNVENDEANEKAGVCWIKRKMRKEQVKSAWLSVLVMDRVAHES